MGPWLRDFHSGHRGEFTQPRANSFGHLCADNEPKANLFDRGRELVWQADSSQSTQVGVTDSVYYRVVRLESTDSIVESIPVD